MLCGDAVFIVLCLSENKALQEKMAENKDSQGRGEEGRQKGGPACRWKETTEKGRGRAGERQESRAGVRKIKAVAECTVFDMAVET